jgi:hypothetical protein
VERTLADLPCSMVLVTHEPAQAERLAGAVVRVGE